MCMNARDCGIRIGGRAEKLLIGTWVGVLVHIGAGQMTISGAV